MQIRISTMFGVASLFAALLLTESCFAQPGLGTGYVPPQQIDKSNGGSSLDANAGVVNANKSAPQNQFQILYRELDNLIAAAASEDAELKQTIENAVTAFQLKNGNRVLEIFNEHRKADPDLPPSDLLMAGMSFASEDMKTGRLLMERAALQHPEHPATFSAFARLALNEGRLTDAIAMLEKTERVLQASSLKSDSKNFYQRLYLDAMTDLAMRQQRFDDARKFLDQQREQLPNNPKTLMVSAELEFKQKNVQKAIEYLTKLREIQPNTRYPETVVAMWFDRVGDKEKADKWITTASTKYADDFQVQLEYANWAVNRGKLPIASEAISKAESNGGETLLSKNLKARIAFSRESYAVAEAHYKSLLEKQRNFDASNMYALCLIESGDEAKQKQAREIAVQNFRALPNNLVAQATMGYVHLKNGDLEQSKSVLASAAQARGRSPEIDFFLASLLNKMGEKKQAKMTLDNALKFDGFFLYRSAAQKLLNSLGGAELPAPTDK